MRRQLKDSWDGAERGDSSLSRNYSRRSLTHFLIIPPHSLLRFRHLHYQGRSERSYMSLERFCEGCGKQHDSAVWYYRNKVDSTAHEWLCSLQYLPLTPQTIWSSHTCLYWNKGMNKKNGDRLQLMKS